MNSRGKDTLIFFLLVLVCLLLLSDLHGQTDHEVSLQGMVDAVHLPPCSFRQALDGATAHNTTPPILMLKEDANTTVTAPASGVDPRSKIPTKEEEAQGQKKNKKPPLFFIWLGDKKMGDTHKAAIASCQRWNKDHFDVQIIRDADVQGMDYLHAKFHLLDNVQKSDYLRAELLHRYGGIYLDTDVFCLRSLKHTLELVTGGQEGLAVGGGAPDLMKKRENVNNNMLGPFVANSSYTRYWHEELHKKVEELTPKLDACAKEHPNGGGGIRYPRQVGPQFHPLCGTRWGELIDFLKDPTLAAYRNGTLIPTFRPCVETLFGNTFYPENCDLFHLGCAISGQCELRFVREKYPQLFDAPKEPEADAVEVAKKTSSSSTAPSPSEVGLARLTMTRTHSATLLYGIFSTSPEKARRDLLRRTILTSLDEHVLCPLHKYIQQVDAAETTKCRILYAFVVGDSPNEPGEHLLNNSSPVAVPPWKDEPDVIRLNIRENMNEGKTPTWFKYASTLVDTYHIDYVAKGDSDTYLWMPHLLNFMNRDLEPAPAVTDNDNRRIYSGWMVDNLICGNHWHCSFLRGKTYMSGQFFFVSSDLVRFLASDPKIDRSKPVPHEDFDLGMRILSHPFPIKLMPLTGYLLWSHEPYLKEDKQWEFLWKMHSKKREPSIGTEDWWPRAGKPMLGRGNKLKK